MNIQSLIFKHEQNGVEALLRRYKKDNAPPDAPIVLNGIGIQLVLPANIPEEERPSVNLGYGNTRRLEPRVIGSQHEIFTVHVLATVNETDEKDLIVRSGDMKSLIDLIVIEMRQHPVRNDLNIWDVQLDAIDTGASIAGREGPTPFQYMHFVITFEYEISLDIF